jgi:hypothetical protein
MVQPSWSVGHSVSTDDRRGKRIRRRRTDVRGLGPDPAVSKWVKIRQLWPPPEPRGAVHALHCSRACGPAPSALSRLFRHLPAYGLPSTAGMQSRRQETLPARCEHRFVGSRQSSLGYLLSKAHSRAVLSWIVEARTLARAPQCGDGPAVRGFITFSMAGTC